MTKPRKRRKLESATWYAIRRGRRWWTGHLDTFDTFADAILLRTRGEALGCARGAEWGDYVIVPVRVRVLASRKRNAKRTR